MHRSSLTQSTWVHKLPSVVWLPITGLTSSVSLWFSLSAKLDRLQMNFSTFLDTSSISALFHQTHTRATTVKSISWTVGCVRFSRHSLLPLIYTHDTKNIPLDKESYRVTWQHLKATELRKKVLKINECLIMYLQYNNRNIKHTTCQSWSCHPASASACRRQSGGLFQPDSAICAALAPAPANQRWTSSLDE